MNQTSAWKICVVALALPLAVACDDSGSDFPSCGDGRVDNGELCDDGNTRDGDSCNRMCRPGPQFRASPTCGNGQVEFASGEECDGTPGCSGYCLNMPGYPGTGYPPGAYPPGGYPPGSYPPGGYPPGGTPYPPYNAQPTLTCGSSVTLDITGSTFGGSIQDGHIFVPQLTGTANAQLNGYVSGSPAGNLQLCVSVDRCSGLCMNNGQWSFPIVANRRYCVTINRGYGYHQAQQPYTLTMQCGISQLPYGSPNGPYGL